MALNCKTPNDVFAAIKEHDVRIVDVKTGKLVSGYRHRASGLDANQAPSYVPNLHSPDTLSWGFIWR